MTKSIDVLRGMMDKEVCVTYINGATITGDLRSFDLGANSLVLRVDNEDVFIITSSVISMQKTGKDKSQHLKM